MEEKIPYEIYIIVNKCENLPDFRGEKEKQKNIKRGWRVIFHETEETLATPLVEGVSDVSWMCETFLKLKSSDKPFWMSVIDDKSQIAGKVVLDMASLPIGDNKLLRPGRKYDGSREAYKNLQPIIKMPLISKLETNCVLSFWIWVLSFKDKPVSNLKKLMFFSKSTTHLCNPLPFDDLTTQNKTNVKPNKNPFENDYSTSYNSDHDNNIHSTNPFLNNKEKQSKLENEVGNSSFMRIEVPKFNTEAWIPRKSTSNLPRISSLQNLSNYKDNNYGVQEFKMELYREKLSFTIPSDELKDFKSLAQYFKIKTATRDDQLVQSLNEEFFSLLNHVQRQYANQFVQIKHLISEKTMINEELCDTRNKFQKLKEKLIINNLFTMLEDI